MWEFVITPFRKTSSKMELPRQGNNSMYAKAARKDL
jgi:hypothetical protein